MRSETLDFVDRAPVVIDARRRLPFAPERVFDVLADATLWPRWIVGMVAAEWTSSPPHGVGSTRRVALGPLQVHERFIAWEPPRLLAFTFVEANAPFARAGVERLDLARVDDDATALRYRMALDPSLGPLPDRFAAAFAPVGTAAAPVLRRSLRRLERLVATRA